jgi:2-polyprenyl-3-methyl-5-hydroxy-6-metoxy-1,4-benzoquinol methylase
MTWISTAPDVEAFDRQYRSWLEGLGPRASDLDWRLTHLPWRQRALIRRYPPEGFRVLDFGCMDGVFTLRLQQLGGEAVGYDISPAAIAQAKQFRGTAARPVFTAVPPGPGQFDRIYCNEVLVGGAGESALIGELVGYLAPAGSVLGTTPAGDEQGDPEEPTAYDAALLRRALAPWGRVRLHRYSRSPLRKLLPGGPRPRAVYIFEVTPPSPPGAR